MTEEQAVAGAIHGLHGELLVLHFEHEHVLKELFPLQSRLMKNNDKILINYYFKQKPLIITFIIKIILISKTMRNIVTSL